MSINLTYAATLVLYCIEAFYCHRILIFIHIVQNNYV